jgi:hypothetical protein
VLMLGLLMPHLDLIARAGRWVLAGASAALGLVLLTVGGLSAGFDARHPQPDTILYALNLDSGQAIWVSADQKPDAWTAQFLGANPQRASVADYLGGSDEKLQAPAPPVALPAPNVRFLQASNTDGVQTVTVRVTGPARANLIVVEAESEIAGVIIDGTPVAERSLSNSGRVSPWTLNFWNPPGRGFDLTLKVQDSAALRLTVRVSTPGLPRIPGTTYRDRPPDVMPISADPASIEQDSSTVVSKSYSFMTP